MPRVDLTTLPGWESLSTGSHNITIVAKAAGYRDSKPSEAVSVEKAAAVTYTDCITFTGETSDFTLRANKEWDGTVEYCTDVTPWTTWDGTDISSNNKKLYLRGSGNTTFYTSSGAQFVLSAKAGCSGNLNTLLEHSNPPTVLSKSECYKSMFDGCTNLTTAPDLPATTLADFCYERMFLNCSSLKVSNTQTGTYQYAWRIPTSGTILSAPSNWNTSMLANTGGTFTSDPSINTTYYVENKPV